MDRGEALFQSIKEKYSHYQGLSFSCFTRNELTDEENLELIRRAKEWDKDKVWIWGGQCELYMTDVMGYSIRDREWYRAEQRRKEELKQRYRDKQNSVVVIGE